VNYPANGVITAARAPVSSDVRITPTSGLSSLTFSTAFDSNLEGQTLPEISELVDFAPMDESWYFSQDFCFDDGIIQWQ
jgi:hypothetical protein